MTKFDAVLLASGGMDSTVLSYKLEAEGKNVVILFLNYGQHCYEKEYNTLCKVLPKSFKNNIKLINISDIYRDADSRMIKEADLWADLVQPDDLYLPYRNLLFLSIASAYAQSVKIDEVYSAFINSNHAKEIDCSLDFFDKLRDLLQEYGSVKINMPFRNMTKTEVAKLGVKLQVPIGQTFSCQVNSKNPCGACPNCVDRLEAFSSLLKEADYGK